MDILPSPPPFDPRHRRHTARATAGCRPDRLSSVAFLSTLPPERCGLATFTSDLMTAIQGLAPSMECVPVAVVGGGMATDGPGSGRHPGIGTLDVAKHDAQAYRRSAAALDDAGVSALCVQHEYGIFGGPDGALLLELVEAARMPVVVTLHTVLERPSPGQRRVMRRLLDRAAGVVVMTQRSAAVMASVHGLPPDRLRVVPHGIPPPLAEDRDRSRLAQAMDGRPTLLTFGLLSPGKGIEHVIAALPALARRRPDILYVVMGATHPNLVREQGEAYRDGLAALAGRLGVAANVRFVNRYVDLPELMQALNAADLYVTPYLNEAQSVSGTLSYSYGSGTPVVSTPYHHAAELLADGRGVLVPFADPDAIAAAVAGLLDDPGRMASMRRAARLDGQRMLWPHVAARYLEVFREAVADPVAGPVGAGA